MPTYLQNGQIISYDGAGFHYYNSESDTPGRIHRSLRSGQPRGLK